MLDTVQLRGKLSGGPTSVVGKGEDCRAEWPVLVLMICYKPVINHNHKDCDAVYMNVL